MRKPKEIKLEDYRYNLPDEKIAKYPLENREHSKLLIYKRKEIHSDNFFNLESYLSSGDMLVFNNTKVIHARLVFRKHTGAKIEIFCLEPCQPSDHQLSFASNSKVRWKCLIGNAKKWKSENLISKKQIDGKEITFVASKIQQEKDSFIIEFSWDNQDVSFSEMIELFGTTPIPPYLNREAEQIDIVRYQTVYSKMEGSVAAPTAGLHFTNSVISGLDKKGIKRKEITLHVGAGTFVPVKTDDAMEHVMHTERFHASRDFLKELAYSDSRVIAVGTTSCRTLESLYWLGVKQIAGKANDFHLGQWEAWDLPDDISLKMSMEALIDYLDERDTQEIVASTSIMIVPGYTFRVISGMITNFHQPSSTLLMLIAAFAGNEWKNIYRYALENDFRFLSYGDSSLLIR